MKITLKNFIRYMPVQKCIAGENISNLSDVEVLAIIIGTGSKKEDVLELASSLLKNHEGLHGLSQCGIREIAVRDGIGLVKAVRIHAAFECGKRVITDNTSILKIDTPEKVWKLLIPEMAGLRKEEFRVLVMDKKNQVVKNSVVSVGTVSETIVHPREVFREAIRENGASIIVAHNHPSGEVIPSKEDVAATKRLCDAGELMGIPLIDHVIISNSQYYSMKEGGYFKP